MQLPFVVDPVPNNCSLAVRRATGECGGHHKSGSINIILYEWTAVSNRRMRRSVVECGKLNAD